MLKRSIDQILERAPMSVLARNTGWMFLGYGLRTIVQASYFILIARALGPKEYGAFVGVVSLIALVSPFASLGAGNLLVKNVSRDRTVFPEYWGNALLLSSVSGVLLLGLVMAVARFALPGSIPWSLILMTSVSDLLAVKGAEIAAQGFQATDQLRYTAALTLLPSLLRLIGAATVFLAWHRSTAVYWGCFYLGSTVISSVVALVLIHRQWGAPKFALWRIRREMAEGFYFGTSMSAQTVYNDIDKTMLARFSTLDATGIYAAAYRLIDVSFTPVRSVLNAAYASFFRHGKEGIASSYSFAKQLLPRVLVYSLLIFAVLFLTAPIIPAVLGSEYARAVETLRWLALLPLLKSIHYFLADSLTGAGYQRIRTAGQVGVAVFNVGLNLWLIPAYSWRGAAWSSLASDGALALTMYLAVTVLIAKEARHTVEFSHQRIEEY